LNQRPDLPGNEPGRYEAWFICSGSTAAKVGPDGARLLAVGIGEDGAFSGDTVDIRGAVTHGAAVVAADVVDADVIASGDEDIGGFFKVSPAAQARIRDLLEKNREATLNTNEVAELDLYEQLEHTMIL
jgi:hypothetical protein